MGELPAFMLRLQAADGLGARALELAILTAGRTSEVIEARWPEFDLADATWTVPAARKKAGRMHRVPLCTPALTLLRRLETIRDGDFVFPGASPGKPLSNMALLATLRRMKRGDLTAHGFRSTFRDWVAERSGFAGDVAEAALAHVVGDKTEATYRRGDLFRDAPPADGGMGRLLHPAGGRGGTATRGLGARVADPPASGGWRLGVLLDMMSGRHDVRDAGRRRRPPLVHR